MTIRFQRLVIILISLILLALATILILINSKNNLIFFYTPTELINSSVKINDKIRIGGIVKKINIQSSDTGDIYYFEISDNQNFIQIEYTGMVPGLFEEEQGAVIEGVLLNRNKILATRVFAKHDENYMPANIKKQLEKKDFWKKNYADYSFNQEVPKFVLPELFSNNKFSNENLIDKTVLVNFFASWCIPCKEEHHLLMKIKKKNPNLLIVGINHKDKKNDAINFLNNEGNPYNLVGIDENSNVAIAFGVFGLPESFLINKKGKIIFKHIGPISKEVLKNDIQPLLD